MGAAGTETARAGGGGGAARRRAAARRRHRRGAPRRPPASACASSAPASLGHATPPSIASSFASLRARGKRAAFIPFLTAGDGPRGLETTAACIRVLCERGADVIELGVPYADPLADGPVIQAASARALYGNKTTLAGVLAMLRALRSGEHPEAAAGGGGAPLSLPPVVLFTYINPILKMGVPAFFEAVRESGGSGVLVPDLPLEESAAFRAEAAARGLDLILLATPTTPGARMREIVRRSSGFTYLVSVTGVTGARRGVEARLPELVRSLREASEEVAGEAGGAPLPVAVGFGVASAETAREVIGYGADGVIVGSALVRAIGEADSEEEGMRRFEEIVAEIAGACD